MAICAGGRGFELVARRGIELRQTVHEGADHLTRKVAARVVAQDAPDDVDDLLACLMPQSGGKVVPLVLQVVLPGLAPGLHLPA